MRKASGLVESNYKFSGSDKTVLNRITVCQRTTTETVPQFLIFCLRDGDLTPSRVCMCAGLLASSAVFTFPALSSRPCILVVVFLTYFSFSTL